jgi:beta-1,4-mannosyltransferase
VYREESNNIYCYPNSLDGNDYLKMNIRLWKEMGLNIKRFQSVLGKLFTPQKWTNDFLVLNFYENSVLGRFPVLRLFRGFLFLLLARLVVKKVIWVRHNYVPHSLNGVKIGYFNSMCFLLKKLSHETVVHRPAKGIDFTRVVPHPLFTYSHVENNESDYNTSEGVGFLCFGQVRENKGMCQLLGCWPLDIKLTIIGACNDNGLEVKIREIIRKRQLNVKWNNMFVSTVSLNDAISQADCIVIPHLDKSMIVTSATFHAMSLGTNILSNESEFSDWSSELYPFSTSFNYKNLSKKIKNLELFSKLEVMAYARDNNSDIKVKEAWASVFDKSE